ncbi:MAG: rhomboid family intramembrane serine protease [Bdellovibrionales bacterium]
MNQPQFQMAVPMTKTVKWLIIGNVTIWVALVLILQGLIMGGTSVFDLLALVPYRVVTEFWIWQVFTYMFLHSSGVFHVLFNMLILWWFGSELESRWGQKFFLSYYLTCGVGAGIIYLTGTVIYYLVTGKMMSMAAPLVGASGAVYGLLLAYGILFGERLIYFMMLFPMKAKYFVMIIGLVELVTMLDSGMGSQVANLAHLGGIGVGFVFLMTAARIRARKSRAGGGPKRGRKLKLVVNNERKPPQDGPRYWN